MFRSVFLKTQLLLILLPLVFYGCQKEKTFYLDLTVQDAETGDPVQVSAVLFYGHEGGTDNQGEISLGNTGEDGHMVIKKNVGKKGGLELRLYAGENYTHVLAYHSYSYSFKVSKGSKVTKTVKLTQKYRYLVSIKNVNCFDETDSVWISLNEQPYSPTYKFVGCVDTIPIYPWTSPLSYTSLTQQASFHVKVKRNGQLTEYDETKNLTKGIISPISIHY